MRRSTTSTSINNVLPRPSLFLTKTSKSSSLYKSNLPRLCTLSTRNHSQENYEKLLLQTYEDPLKKDFDARMHRHYGSASAQTLSPSDQSILMPKDNTCVVLTKLEQLEYFELEKPNIIEPWEVLLEVTNVGVCGSDFEYFKHGKIGPLIMTQPFIMGHETGARIISLGKAAEEEGRLKINDIVALEPGLVCGECDACQMNLYNLCPSVTFFATPPVHGTMRKYMKHHYKYCYTVGSANDNNNNTEEINKLGEIAALCEPLSVGIHAGGTNVASIKDGDFIGIFGAGPIGIINMLCAIYYGATKIFITDIIDKKLDIVRKYIKDNENVLGTKCQVIAINSKETPLSREFLQQTFSVRDGRCDHTIECVGNEFVLNSCLEFTRPGGMVTVIGMASDMNMNIDVSAFNIMEKHVNGVFRYRYTYPDAIKLLTSGKVGNVRSLITSRLNALDKGQLEEGFETIGNNVKIMFEM